MDEKQKQLKNAVYDKLLEPIKNFGGVYDADREVYSEFSQKAPIGLLKEILSIENLNDCSRLAIEYWRNPDAKKFDKYKKDNY